MRPSEHFLFWRSTPVPQLILKRLEQHFYDIFGKRKRFTENVLRFGFFSGRICPMLDMINLTLEDLASTEREGKWLNSLAKQETRRAYARAIQKVRRAKPHDLSAWLNHPRYSVGTMRVIQSALRSYAKFINKTLPVPAKTIKPRKRKQPTPDLIDLVRVQRGIDTKSATGARDWLIFWLLMRGYSTDQIVALRCNDLKLHKNTLHKTPLSDEALKIFHEYLRLDWPRRKIQHTDSLEHPLLQASSKNRTLEHEAPMTPQMVRLIIRKWCEFAGMRCDTRTIIRQVKQGIQNNL